MFVYANELYIEDDEGAGYRCALGAVGQWLSSKVHEPVDLNDTSRGLDWDAKKGSKQLKVFHTNREVDEFPWMSAIEFSHGDDSVSGRKWITQIGLQQQEADSNVRLTLLLETSDISADVGAEPVEPSRPYVVTNIERQCKLAPNTFGQHINKVTRDDADDLKDIIDQERSFALILVSPRRHLDGAPIDLDYLRMQVMGLAQVIYIPDRSDAFHIHKRLGSIRSAFNGAVNILHPRVNVALGYIPHDLLLPDQIEELRESDHSIEKYLLRLVVHRQNLRHYWHHVSPEKVRRHRLHRRLHATRKRVKTGEQSAEVQELISLYEETNAELVEERDKLADQINNYEMQILRKDQELEEKDLKIQSLKYHLRQKTKPDYPIPEGPPLRQFDKPKDVIEVVEEEMGDRILLQNRARKSMRDSPFQSPEDVYQAFMLLYEHFYPALAGDGSLEQAMERTEELNIVYSHKMSEITMGQSGDYNIKYAGRQADMNKHLKLGSSRNPQHCFRIHFEYDAEAGMDGLIVVHHAGKHLETTST